jgi:hypothetical protein
MLYTTHEMELGVESMAFGEIHREDESFSHEFGLKEQQSFEVRNFSIVVWLDGDQENDITKSLTAENLQYFKTKFLQHFFKSIGKECA